MTANGDFLDEINTQDEANVAMDMLYKRLKKFSINLNNIVSNQSILLMFFLFQKNKVNNIVIDDCLSSKIGRVVG